MDISDHVNVYSVCGKHWKRTLFSTSPQVRAARKMFEDAEKIHTIMMCTFFHIQHSRVERAVGERWVNGRRANRKEGNVGSGLGVCAVVTESTKT